MDFDFQLDSSVSTFKDDSLPPQPEALRTQPVIRKSSCACAFSHLIARHKDSATSAPVAVTSDT